MAYGPAAGAGPARGGLRRQPGLCRLAVEPGFAGRLLSAAGADLGIPGRCRRGLSWPVHRPEAPLQSLGRAGGRLRAGADRRGRGPVRKPGSAAEPVPPAADPRLGPGHRLHPPADRDRGLAGQPGPGRPRPCQLQRLSLAPADPGFPETQESARPERPARAVRHRADVPAGLFKLARRGNPVSAIRPCERAQNPGMGPGRKLLLGDRRFVPARRPAGGAARQPRWITACARAAAAASAGHAAGRFARRAPGLRPSSRPGWRRRRPLFPPAACLCSGSAVPAASRPPASVSTGSTEPSPILPPTHISA